MPNRILKIIKNIIFTFIFILFGCKTTKLPNKKYYQYEYEKSYSYKNDSLKIEIKNPLYSPLRIWFINSDSEIQNKLNQINPIVLESKTDTIITLTNILKFNNQLSFSSRLGSLSKKITEIQLDFPFKDNKEYAVLQGNNTNFTHSTNWSKYAIDFNLKTNDTICSATNGYVVGVVNDYKYSGKGQEWKSFSNFITIYEPNSGIFCQYAHLVKNGSLVKVGDKIERGQKIGLSGNTGQSTREHLHFSCLIPVNTEDGLKSIPITFVNGQKGIELKNGDKVKK